MTKDGVLARNLILRRYANKHGDQWKAFRIDLCLAAQGYSFPEVKQKLGQMIDEHVYDVLAGEDREFAEQLLNRKAPFSQIATYHWIGLMHRLGNFRNELHKLIKEIMPLVPQHHAHA